MRSHGTATRFKRKAVHVCPREARPVAKTHARPLVPHWQAEYAIQTYCHEIATEEDSSGAYVELPGDMSLYRGTWEPCRILSLMILTFLELTRS